MYERAARSNSYFDYFIQAWQALENVCTGSLIGAIIMITTLDYSSQSRRKC